MCGLIFEKALKRGDYPCGCVIIRGEEIIAKASSKGITSKNPTAHAEIIAIHKACKKLKSRYLKNCIIYTNIEPCLMCGKAIVYSKIRKVVYGTEHKEYEKRKTFSILKKNGIGKNIKVISGIEKKRASELLNKFLLKYK